MMLETDLHNPFIKGGGVQKVIEEDLNNLIEELNIKNFRLNTKAEVHKLSCKALRVMTVLINELSLIFKETKVSSIKISPTYINKFIRFKTNSSIVEALQELELIGFVKAKKIGRTNKVREYWFNPFYFFIGSKEIFLNLFSQDIKVYYPELYVKLFIKT